MNIEELKKIVRGNGFQESHGSTTIVIDVETVVDLLDELKQCDIHVVSNWVAVTEKLPLKDGDYLVFEDDFVFEACYDKEKNIWRDYEVTIYKDVTHWRELPKPPCC